MKKFDQSKDKVWENIFSTKGKVFTEIQKDIPMVVNLFKENNVKKVLDIGCGTGRHVLYLAKNGFDVYGLDESKTAIKIAKHWLNTKNLKAQFKIGNQYKKFPFKEKYFDAIISTQALHHGITKDVEKVIGEIKRVLKNNGIIFITVARKRSRKEIKSSPYLVPKSKQIEKNVYIPLEGREKGLPHFLFNKTLIKKKFLGFCINDIHKDDSHYCFIGHKKDGDILQ
jgi:ubiquinone/menaquinone biosynthesis C-methylase UbiE